jgi:CheY-like chemotaxis protein
MARPGYRLSITLEMQSMPEHALLNFKARPTVSDSNPELPHASAPYRLSWWLLVEAAALAQIPLQHSESAQNLSLMLEFRRTVKQLEKSNPMDLSNSTDSWASSHSKLPAGQRILLVTADAGLVDVIAPLCRSSHVILDSVSSTEQASARCEAERPHMLIFDQRLSGLGLESIRRELLAADPQMPVLEVTDDQHSLTMTSWVDDAIERINRDNLTNKLPSVLARLLGKSA